MTGGTGFVGAHLTRLLLDHDADVTALSSRPRRSHDALGDLSEVPPFAVVEAALDDEHAVKTAVDAVAPEIVFHLAAYSHAGDAWDDAAACLRVNVEGTANLIAAVAPHAPAAFVHTSSAAVYGVGEPPFHEDDPLRPASPYAISKHAAELLCGGAASRFGLHVVQLRLFNTYGPGQTPDRIIPGLIAHGLDREPLAMTSGEQTREFNFVGDVVHAIALAALVGRATGQTINIGGGEETSIADLARTVLGRMGDPVEPDIGALETRPVEMMRLCANAERASELLGWEASTSLADGLDQTIAWYAAQRGS